MTSKKSGSSAVLDRPTKSGRAAAMERPAEPEKYRAASMSVNWPQANSSDSFARRFGMDENSIASRRQFVRLSDQDRSVLAGLAGWAEDVAPHIAREFYDWQFEFPATRQFFEKLAAERGMPLAALRSHLEGAQSGYLIEIFAGASVNWDLRYFEKRLQVGAVHDRINLPFKWYVGSYPEYQRLFALYLRRDFRNEAMIAQVEGALGRVFNLDLQAIGDAFVLNTLEKMLAAGGIMLDDVCSSGDRADQVGRIKQAIHKQIDGFVTGMKHMAEEHEKGEIDATIPPEGFLGSFKVMAQGVNEMVAGHISVKKKAMACVSEFAKGNFDAPLEKFPGKKAFINDNLERLRTNVQSFIRDMKNMSDEHNKGDIDVTIPPEAFEGDFKVMAQGVNEMVAGHITVKKKAMACIAEFGKGNFKAVLENSLARRRSSTTRLNRCATI